MRRASTAPVIEAQPPRLGALLREALASVLSPELCEEVLKSAGWDEATQSPHPVGVDLEGWVDSHLIPELAAGVGWSGAEAVREDLCVLLPCGLPSRTRDCRTSMVTIAPHARPRPTVFVWSEGTNVAAALDERLAGRARAVGVCDPEVLAYALEQGSAKVVLLDLRGAAARSLAGLSARDFAGRRVVTWGAGADAPHVTRLLARTERAVGCAAEADTADVASVCAGLLARVERPSA